MGGEHLPACRLTYGQIAAGRKMWSDERYARSTGGDPSKRHYLISGVVPIAVASLAEATEKLRGAPCLASRGILAGLYSTIDDALRANDMPQNKGFVSGSVGDAHAYATRAAQAASGLGQHHVFGRVAHRHVGHI